MYTELRKIRVSAAENPKIFIRNTFLLRTFRSSAAFSAVRIRGKVYTVRSERALGLIICGLRECLLICWWFEGAPTGGEVGASRIFTPCPPEIGMIDKNSESEVNPVNDTTLLGEPKQL